MNSEYVKAINIVELNDGVYFNIHSSVVGHQCGLPLQCHCTLQNTIRLNAANTIENLMEKKSTTRVFSYEKYGLLINVITTSITYSEYCRY